jgi:16S rRNA (guanine966-N2)-methyltransferase
LIRVTSGKYRGRSVDSPPRSKEIRPTAAVMRESIFSRFQFDLPGSRFLDLFAGSGIMGLEALSRGADFVLAIEGDAVQCKVIRRNLEAIGIREDQLKVSANDVVKLLASPCRKEAFDFVFMDPPYGFADLAGLVTACIDHGWVKPDGVLIVEHGVRDEDLPGFTRKDYGDTSISTRLLAER